MNVAMVQASPLDRRETQVVRHALAYCIHGSFEDARPLRGAWNALAARTGDILCSFDWCEVWWEHFGAGRRLEIHALHDGRRLVAVLPLFRETIRPCGVPLRTVRVLGCDYTIATAGMAVEPAYAKPFTTMLLQAVCRRGPWDILEMAPLQPYQTAFDTISDACSQDPHVQTVIVSRNDCWCTLFELPDTYEKYLEALPGDDRRNMLRRQRRLQEGRNVELSMACTPREVQEAMDALIHWHHALWVSRGRSGQFAAWPAIERFHRTMAQQMAKTGQLALVTLKVDGQVLGASYACFFGSRMHGLFCGYSPEQRWRPFGLGTLLYNHMIRLAIERKATQIDTGRGVYEYKLRLGGRLHLQRSLVVVHKGWQARLRFWGAMRGAYLMHLLYSRLWLDVIVPRIGVRAGGCHLHVRYSVLARLLRRVTFGLFGNPPIIHKRSIASPGPQTSEGCSGVD